MRLSGRRLTDPFVGFLLERFERDAAKDAMVWMDRAYSYRELLDLYRESRSWIVANGIPVGARVMLHADFSPRSVAVLLALVAHRSVVVPYALAEETRRKEFCATACVQFYVRMAGDEVGACERVGTGASHALLDQLAARGVPGLILFSSGSTGPSKAALHDFSLLLEKFKTPRPARRMCAFLLFDHIGGLNTLLFSLSNGACLIALSDRNPRAVARAIEAHRAQVLPTSPSFLNLLMLTEAYKTADLSSLELVTYGTEPMPESTLMAFHQLFPRVTLQQTYGLSELGILRSKSKSSDSLWVKVGGEGFETRVRDGLLEIKAKSAMLGYLNAPSPFTEDGWFMTGDMVEEDGEYLRILGRKSELINVGGQKTFPAGIESVIQSMDGVEEVSVFGEPNAILGQIVVARVVLGTDENLPAFRTRLKLYCKERLEPYKVPQKVILAETSAISGRFKKIRRMEAPVGEAGKDS